MIYTRPEFNNVSMLAIFCMEIEKQVVLLNASLLTLENQPDMSDAGTVQALEALMRSTHSIKGAARIVGLNLAVEVAHAMEDCLVAVKQGQLAAGSQTVDVLLAGVDWFTQLGQVRNDAQADWLAQQTDQTGELLSQMRALLTAPVALPLPDRSDDGRDEEGGSVSNRVGENGQGGLSDRTPPTNSPIAEAENSDQTLPPEPNADRVVRVNADNLNHLMALAGESLVEVNWLQPFADTMQHLKQQQQALTGLLEQLQQEVKLPPTSKKKLDAAQKLALDGHALLSDRMGDLDQFSRRFSQLSDNLYREVIASHMRPFADGTQRFARMVRDIAKAEGKQVKLTITGQNTQIDRDILDQLEAPLTHMLRNAIVHGIESPEQRQQLGKPAVGTIRLEASHRAGMLSIIVSDDGCGIDIEQLRHSVVQKQLTSSDLAAQLSEAELMEFLFLPGFSTAQQVTEMAGRGVGLDIAKSMVQTVGGLLRASTKLGQGLSFHFQLPLTLSVIRALVVEISGEPYAFGLTRIDQVRLVKPEEIAISESRPYIVVNGENISLVKAQQVLELPEVHRGSETALPVVILRDQTHSYGIVVDKLLGEQELVVRPLDQRFGKVQDVSAAALTETGLPLLIVDVADLLRSIEQMATGGNLGFVGDRPAPETQRQQRVLVVDDSLTVREMERQLLQNHGYRVDVAVNGMEGWNTVRTGDYDLVISDIDMPRMNGIELVQQIKAHPQLKQLPVIIVSYKDRQTDRVAGLNAGADYYLTKSSFQDNSLLTAVKDLIG